MTLGTPTRWIKKHFHTTCVCLFKKKLNIWNNIIAELNNKCWKGKRNVSVVDKERTEIKCSSEIFSVKYFSLH